MTTRYRRSRVAILTLVVATLALSVGACESTDKSGGGSGAKGDPVVIGASLPMTGAFERFGVLTKLGYETAVKKVNDAGGLKVGSGKRPVELKILDDQSDPKKASENANELILKDKAVALLGSVTPPQNIPVAQVAEARGIPLVVTGTPIRAFLSAAPKGGYKWSYVMFFDEPEMTQLAYKTMDRVESNKRVALFTDQEQDGEVMGKLWTDNAAKNGYTIAYHATFPVGTTDYGDSIRKAQQSGADIMIAQMIPPDAIALWKQMKALDWKPKAAFVEKAANSGAWWAGLETDATGTMATGWWAPELGYPDTAFVEKTFAKEAKGNVEIGQVTDAYTIAQVLMDAISKAGSTEPKAIGDELSKTDGEYVSGSVKFDKDHAAPLKLVVLQWTKDGETAVEFPESAAKTPLTYPLPPW